MDETISSQFSFLPLVIMKYATTRRQYIAQPVMEGTYRRWTTPCLKAMKQMHLVDSNISALKLILEQCNIQAKYDTKA